MQRIVYLTGAPATGKSTLTENLHAQHPSIDVFAYSQELLAHVQARGEPVSSQDDLRNQSSQVITREDVEALDRRLIGIASECRGKRSLVIDSHPVTIEKYGFRITPFSKGQIRGLAPDVIVCLYAEADIIAERIGKHPKGRPIPSSGELAMHAHLQSTIAGIYPIESGAALYFLDASYSPTELLANFLRVTKLTAPR